MVQDATKICTLLHSLTKLNTRFVHSDGHVVFQLIQNKVSWLFPGDEEEPRIMNQTLRNHPPHSFYYYINTYGLEYIAAGIWKDGEFLGSISIGPFLSSIPASEFIRTIISKNKLPISDRKQLQEFYHGLTVLSSTDSNSLGDLLVNLCSHPHIDSQLITTELIQQNQVQKPKPYSIDETKEVIELRYHYEKKLMDAITKGNKEELIPVLNASNSILNFADRVPESPIRSAKNISFTVNTLCRIAAERGGVHPVQIHMISEKFAILIERAPNLPYLKELLSVMTMEYCDMVKTYSTQHLSPIVKKAVNYITFHLEKPLTLTSIAKELGMNPSHLSRKFKAETTMSVIDFINHKRIEEAKFYLKQGDVSITDIAFMTGFSDVNYFSRVFKKWTSLTPTEYSKTKTAAD
ncbi:AraC family transcriptional regulator [Neobacillus dielmonensis]|uniref:AraC family transcriptional regulator n=1 Tax=Neobacillus dielmonensis TaxID=1347369 RepID=UPI001F183204|nr:AraC family transcriptional regulator [Neobacillus dielmonensis]